MGRKYSAEYGLPQYEHVLIPRTKVTYAAIASLKDKIQSVYDICILYTNKSNNLLSNECEYLNNTSLYSLLKLEAPEVHVHLTRIPINTFYNVNNNNNRRELSEEDVGNWLINSFEKKDKLLHSIHLKNFDALSAGCLINFSLKETLPSVLFLSVTTLALFSTKFGRKLFKNTFLYGSVFTFLSIKLFSLKN